MYKEIKKGMKGKYPKIDELLTEKFTINLNVHNFNNVELKEVDGEKYIIIAKQKDFTQLLKYAQTTKTKKVSKTQIKKMIMDMLINDTNLTVNGNKKEFTIDDYGLEHIPGLPNYRALMVIGKLINKQIDLND